VSWLTRTTIYMTWKEMHTSGVPRELQGEKLYPPKPLSLLHDARLLDDHKMAPFTSFKVISRSGGKWIGILAHLGRALETVSGLKRHRSRFGTGCPLFCGAPFEDRSGEVAEPRSHQVWSSDFGSPTNLPSNLRVWGFEKAMRHRDTWTAFVEFLLPRSRKSKTIENPVTCWVLGLEAPYCISESGWLIVEILILLSYRRVGSNALSKNSSMEPIRS
jgi:hypothetical protein